MPTLHRIELSVFADYHQFYVMDGGIAPDVPVDWSDRDVNVRVKASKNVVVVSPIRSMTVPVTVEVCRSQPAICVEEYDQVVRCSLELPTGYLQVHESSGGELLHLSVSGGTYGVLVLFSNLGAVSENGLEGNDSYHVFLWPDEPAPLTLLKAWNLRQVGVKVSVFKRPLLGTAQG